MRSDVIAKALHTAIGEQGLCGVTALEVSNRSSHRGAAAKGQLILGGDFCPVFIRVQATAFELK